MYLNFYSLFSTEVAQIDEILPQGRPGSTYLTVKTKHMDADDMAAQRTWALIQYKVFPRYGDTHVKDRTVLRPSYL